MKSTELSEMGGRWIVAVALVAAALVAATMGGCAQPIATPAADAGGFLIGPPDAGSASKDVKTKDTSTKDTGAKDGQPEVGGEDTQADADNADATAADAAVDAGSAGEDSSSGDPCDPNPCTEPNKTTCEVGGDGKAECKCDPGVPLQPDGKTCGAPCDPKNVPDPPDIEPGALVITEMMIWPKGNADNDAEWFEVMNTTKKPISIDGLIVTDGNNDYHEVHACPAEALVIKPGGVLVMARTADQAKNGGFKAGYVYGAQFKFSNAADSLILQGADPQNPIDEVKYDPSWVFHKNQGKAMSLDTTVTTAVDNDLPESWCAGTTQMKNGDWGSPGAKNPDCPEPPDTDADGIIDALDVCPSVPDADQSDTDADTVGDACDNCLNKDNVDQADADADGKGDACDPQQCGDAELDLNETCDDGNSLKNDGCEQCQLAAVVAGKVAITELMVKTDDDLSQEWFEVRNTTTEAVKLNGWAISLKKNQSGTGVSEPIPASPDLIVPPGGYLVFGRSADKAINGNVPVNYVYKSLLFPNDGDELALVDTANQTVVDKVAYGMGGNTPAVLPGKSFQIDPGYQNALDNDKLLYWCYGAQPILDKSGNSKQYGTPGGSNTTCAPAGQDVDGDGLNNETDNCKFVANLDQADDDKDGVGNGCDVCPAFANPGQKDSDADGVGDACDNCLAVPNKTQADANGNGWGDACDSAKCGDGVVQGPAEACDDGNKTSGDGCSQTCQKESFAAGALMVSEYLTNPKAVANDVGEWLELYNPGEVPIDLNGWVLRDDANPAKDKVVLTSTTALRVMPKGYFVLGNSADKASNGGYTPTYTYDTTLFSLANGTDQIVLEWKGVAIDKVSYCASGAPGCSKPWSFTQGKALQLDPESYDVGKNDDPGAWCDAKTWYGQGDWGSPGQSNPPCINPCEGKPNLQPCGFDLVCLGFQCVPAPKCGDGSVNMASEECDDGNLKDGDGCSKDCKKEIPVQPDGTLVITEIMVDPDALTDLTGEWFEVYNAGSKPIDLTGWKLQSNCTVSGCGNSHTVVAGGSFVPNPPVVQPKTYAVLAAMADTTLNNGLKPVYAWLDQKAAGGNFQLENKTTAQGLLRLTNAAGKVVDEVVYGPMPWAPGASMWLKPELTTPADNDKKESWSPSSLGCTYGTMIDLTVAGVFDYDLGSACTSNAQCTDGLTKCIPVKKMLNSAGKTIYVSDKSGSLNCAVLERGTPGAANTCK
jgi:cysteine-rich repeat protein